MTKKLLIIIPSSLLVLAILITLPLYAIHQRDAGAVLKLARMLRAGEIERISPIQMARFQEIRTGFLVKMGLLDKELGILRTAYRDQLAETLETPKPPDRRRLDSLLTFQSFSESLPEIDARTWWKDDLGEQLAAELAFVGSWQEHNIEIRITRDLRKRLAVIRSALVGHPFARKAGSTYHFRARRYLMQQTIESVMTLAANPDAESVLVDMLPTVADFEAIRIPLILIHNRLKSGESGIDDEKQWRTIRDGLEEIRRKTAERAFLMERVINDMLEGLDFQQQRNLLNHGITVLKDHYLFDLADRAWPEGVSPLPAVLSSNVAQRHGPSGRVVRRLCREPIYLAELESTKAVAAVRVYRTALLNALKQVFDRIAADDWQDIDTRKLDALQRRIQALSPPDRPYLKQWRTFFERQESELLQIKVWIKRWVYHNLPADRAEVLERLKDVFARLCREADRLGQGPCEEVY